MMTHVDPESGPGAPRRAWVAALLSLLAPGLGHLYAGSVPRAVAVVLASYAISLLALAVSMRLPARAILPTMVLMMIAVPVLVAVDAARLARGQPASYRRRRYQRWYVYLGVLAVMAFVVQPGVRAWAATHLVHAVRLPGGSMEPTLLSGDHVLTRPVRRALARGQLAVYHTRSGSFMKRIVGLSGDTLAMQDGRLFVNGSPVEEPYARAADVDPVTEDFRWQRNYLVSGIVAADHAPSLGNWGPLVVPDGHVFVLGDNRGESLDSRYVGFIPADSVVKEPTVIYFSADAETGAVRWERIGQAAGR